MSSAIENLFNSVVTSTTKVVEAGGRAAAEFVNDTAEEIADIGRAADRHGLAGGAVEFFDAISLGTTAANVADALGVIPEGDALTKNLLSGAVNFFAGGATNPGTWVDAYQAAEALAQAPRRPGVRGARCHQPPTPAAGKGRLPPRFGAGSPSGPRSVLEGIDAQVRGLADQLARLLGEHKVPAPTCRRAPGQIRVDLPQHIRDAIEARKRGDAGGSVIGRPIDEVSYADIFNDQSLSFEDLLFLVMMKVGSDMQKEMEAQLRQLAEINQHLDGGQGGEVGGQAKVAHGGAQDAGAGLDIGEMLASVLSPDNLRGIASGGLDLVSALAPIVLPAVLGAVGTVVPGLGNIVGLVGGEAIGLAGSAICQLLKGAVQSGGFDGLLEGASSLGGAPMAAGGAAGGEANPGGEGLDKLDEDGLRRRRDEAFERLKMLQQKMSEMQQTLSNIMNAQHETAMAAIRNIR